MLDIDIFDAALAEPERPEFSNGPLSIPPSDRHEPRRRGLIKVANPTPIARPTMRLEDFGNFFHALVSTYMANPDPKRILLIKAPAGVGKSHHATALAEQLAAAGRRVLYAGPKREFVLDVQAMAKHPQWIQLWHARSIGDPNASPPKPATCRYEREISAWMQRGYEATAFCSNSRVCGWDYMKECPFHKQKENAAPIIFGQHQHVALGHPLMAQFHLVIGDELPLGAFMREWKIPLKAMVPPDMPAEPLETLLRNLRFLACNPPDSGPRWEGRALYEALPGGAAGVLEAIAGVVDAADIEAMLPDLHGPERADEMPYFHLFELASLMRREAARVVDGLEVLPRVRLDAGGLTLLLRHKPPEDLPKHVIWLDATGDAGVYQALFQRDVEVVEPLIEGQGKIYQLWSSSNNRSSMLNDEIGQDGETAGERKLDAVRAQVWRIMAKYGYNAPAIVTHKPIYDKLLPDVPSTWFGGSRGTNTLQGCDALFVVGTPMPNPSTIRDTTAMLFFERDEPLLDDWYAADVEFAGAGAAHSVNGYWDDPDLSTVLRQYREAELVQAVNRSRMLRRKVDVWLLTNVAVPGMPVTLVSLPKLFDAVRHDGKPLRGISMEQWPMLLAMEASEANPLTAARVVEGFGIARATAGRWMDALIETGQYRTQMIRGERGRPQKALIKVPRSAIDL